MQDTGSKIQGVKSPWILHRVSRILTCVQTKNDISTILIHCLKPAQPAILFFLAFTFIEGGGFGAIAAGIHAAPSTAMIFRGIVKIQDTG